MYRIDRILAEIGVKSGNKREDHIVVGANGQVFDL